MTFRSRVALALGIGAILPLLLLAWGVRREMTRRLTGQANDRVALQISRANDQIRSELATVGSRLDRLAASLADDNRFRAAAASGEIQVPFLRDWAAGALRQSGLSMLELVDPAGLILSSGHFRNEFGRSHRGLAQAIEQAGEEPTVLRSRDPSGERDVLVRSHRFDIAGKRFFLVGGAMLEVARLLPGSDPEVHAAFVAPAAGEGDALAEIPLRFLTLSDTVLTDRAAIVLRRDLAPMLAIRRSVDRWFLGAILVMLLLTGGLALWLSSRVTRPLAELAGKTARLDLDCLDQTFATGRSDEIGTLSRLLDAMTERLRASAGRLREAERRAATGDLARQINHDVKNGLAPIRHVLRHLGQVAADQPESLAGVFKERQGTLESSVAYLENLSRNYARLSPAMDRSESNPNALLREIAGNLGGSGVPVELHLAESVTSVRADSVALRRILENLGGNAVDAAKETNGRVTLSSDATGRDGVAWVRLTVADSGKGMSQAELDRAFDDFYTTKNGGTGLGLSVVRRLIADVGGALRVETAPGQGSRFIVDLPAGGTG